MAETQKKATAQKAAAPVKKAAARQRRRTDYGKAADRTAPVQKPADASARAAIRAPRTDPIRVTLDLEPAQHKALKRWCAMTTIDADLTNVSLASVLRILGDLLVSDDDLADKVKARLIDDSDAT